MSLEEDILIERYLKNELDNKERTVFEERLKKDSEFNEKVSFEKELFSSFNENEWNFHHDNEEDVKDLESYFEKKEVKELQQNIKSSFESIKKKNSPKIKRLYYVLAVAASIALLLGVFLNPFNPAPNSNELFAHYSSQELPTFVNRGDNSLDELVKAENYYKEKDYAKASEIFNNALEKGKASANVYIYSGLSYIQLGEQKKSEEIFDSLINSDLIDAEKGYWYKALLYLKSNNAQEAKKELNYIVKNTLYNTQKARELLEKID
ncbi:tetratricopeptide repeat protein [Tenacibaculum xiamenense]|uniref:tetratricopeptide repeat protein n=1 Tax=Tenacibaculum xiamenense TaxID=1261553 RepID=UPI003893CE0D